MPQEKRSRFWRKARVYFRRLRITVLLVLLAVLGVLIFLDLHGLPEFAKRPILEKLKARGIDLEFSRLRLRTVQGLVAEDVRFSPSREPEWPHTTAKEVELNLNPWALLRLQTQVDSLELRGAKIVVPVIETNAPPRAMVVENIEATLRLLPGDEWYLDDFRAQFAGARFFVSGNITNASEVRNWRMPRGEVAGRVIRWPERLPRIADVVEKISFATPPELRLRVDGDALNLSSFTVRLTLNAPQASTPWGQTTNVILAARLFPGAGGELSHFDLNLQAADAFTPWADAANLDLDMSLSTVHGQINLVAGDVTAQATRAVTRWGAFTNAQLTARWFHSMTNYIPLSGHGELRTAAADTPWAKAADADLTVDWERSPTNNWLPAGRAELRAASATTRWAEGNGVRLSAAFATVTNAPPADDSWAWWTNLLAYQLDLDCDAAAVKTDKLAAKNMSVGGGWRAPFLSITNLRAELYDGALDARGQLDVATREAVFSLTSDFDAQKVNHVLTPQAQDWLSKFSWSNAPHVSGSGAVVLPAWTNRQPDWRAEVRPTLRLAGEFAVTNGAYQGIPADWARSRATYTNQVWHLPDLEVGRGNERLRVEHIADDKTRDYYFRIHSTADLRVARSQLSTNQQRGFDLISFTGPPVIEGELWGRWREYDRIGFRGRVVLTNFGFRDQAMDRFESDLTYTNRMLDLFAPYISRGTQILRAAAIHADFDARRAYITNGFSTADPQAVARAIGPKIGRHMEQYIFREPPIVRVEGYAPMKDEPEADLRFDIVGGPFRWSKFNTTRISGTAHWRDETLSLSNVQADLYRGKGTGGAWFDFNRNIPGADFKFNLNATNIHLPTLMADLSAHTNRLEGRLALRLSITNANSTDLHSWNGYGRVRIKDGLIWEIPIFGVLSKPLDSISSGLGSSEVSEGSGRFGIRKGVIYSDDLEMRALTMRLQYEGSVDFNGQVDARVRAEPLRDVWIFGPLVNLALWPVTKMFEYKISGTLADPKSEPVYLPTKLLMVPLHPIQTLQGLFTTESPKTNGPPIFSEPPRETPP